MSTATDLAPIPTGTLADAAQILIDTRLDTIERMLLGQVSRTDRLAIVRDVEAQIYDHLAERNPHDNDRDAVIAALGRLDPPEAYLPDEAGLVPRVALSTPGTRVRTAPRLVEAQSPVPVGAGVGKVSGILGIIAMILLVGAGITLSIALNIQNTLIIYPLVGLTLATITAATVAVNLAAYARFQGPWAIVGFTTGIIALLISLPGLIFVVM